MNYTKCILLVDDSVKVVRVNYDSAGNDRFFKTLIQDLKKDDLVVIPTSTRHNFTVGKVAEIDCLVDLDDNTQLGWIAQKVDNDAYEATLKQESVAVEQIKSAELRQKKSALLDAIKVDRAAITGMLAAPVEAKAS